MLRRLAEDRFAAWLLVELERARLRVRELRNKYPSAPLTEQAQRLIDDKKRVATTGGAIGGMFGFATIPAELALVAYLQLSLIVDLAVLCGRNLKSARARRELWDVFVAAQESAREPDLASRRATSRLGERLLSTRGLRMFRAVPVLGGPVTAAINGRDLQKVGEEAMRAYAVIPRALSEKRLGR